MVIKLPTRLIALACFLLLAVGLRWAISEWQQVNAFGTYASQCKILLGLSQKFIRSIEDTGTRAPDADFVEAFLSNPAYLTPPVRVVGHGVAGDVYGSPVRISVRRADDGDKGPRLVVTVWSMGPDRVPHTRDDMSVVEEIPMGSGEEGTPEKGDGVLPNSSLPVH